MIELLRDGEVPVYAARATGPKPPKWLDDWYIARLIEGHKSGRTPKGVVCRGVALDRLPYVLEHGVDVQPGQPLWVDVSLDKAWEYGGPYKLLMILSNEALVTSHHILPFDAPNDQLEVCRKEFRTCLPIEARSQFWFSRLDANDTRIGSDYEVAYCRFPAGDTRACLVALVVVLPPDAEIEPVMALLT